MIKEYNFSSSVVINRDVPDIPLYIQDLTGILSGKILPDITG